MTTVEINITGNSLLAYVTLFDEDIHGQLNEMEEGALTTTTSGLSMKKSVSVRDVAFAKTVM